MEQTITYLVQHWDNRYEYWRNVSEPQEGLFSVPQIGYETEDAARAKLTAMRDAYPSEKYRLVRQTTTVEEI